MVLEMSIWRIQKKSTQKNEKKMIHFPDGNKEGSVVNGLRFLEEGGAAQVRQNMRGNSEIARLRQRQS